MKKLIALLFLGLVTISAIGCSADTDSEPTAPADTEEAAPVE